MSKLRMYRGDATVFPLAALNADGSAMDISAGALTFTAKKSRSPASSPVMQYTEGDGITVTDAAGGLFEVKTTPADTSSLYAPQYLFWDVEFVTSGGDPITLITGDLLVQWSVS